MKINYCSICWNPSNHPLGITFDEKNICSGCIVHNERYSINWSQRKKQIKKIFSKNYNSYYDCVIPVSGNGDDFFVVDYAKNELNLNPLIVNFNTHYNSKVGIRNMARLISKLDCDHISMTISPKVMRSLSRFTLDKIGDFYWPILAGQQAFPVQVALKFDIPFILWGVNGYLDQVGKFSHYNLVEMSKRIWEEFSCRGFEAHEIFEMQKNNINFKLNDINPLIYPNLSEIIKKNIRGIYLGNYIFWDSKLQTEKMIKKYGYETFKEQRTYNTYESIYCIHNSGMHDYNKFLKHGFCKVTDHVNRDIRYKRINREDGKHLIKCYSSLEPENINILLEDLSISRKFFYEKSLKFRSKYLQKFDYTSVKKSLNITNKLKEIEERINYQISDLLEPQSYKDKNIIFGRTYMDKNNFKSTE